LQFYKDSKLIDNNNNNENLFDASASQWKNYTRAWIEAYNEFIKYYTNFTENWLRLGTAPQLNGALGVASMVNGVNIIGANITADKEITVTVGYRGNKSSPAITVEAGAVKFNLADVVSSSLKLSSKSSAALSGKSKLNSGWKSPVTLIIELAGNPTLNDANFIGIRVHK
jgi:hypothetical protein